VQDDAELRARIEAQVAARRAQASVPPADNLEADEEPSTPLRPRPSGVADPQAVSPNRVWPARDPLIPAESTGSPPPAGSRLGDDDSTGLEPVRPWLARAIPSAVAEAGPVPSNPEAVLSALADGVQPVDTDPAGADRLEERRRFAQRHAAADAALAAGLVPGAGAETLPAEPDSDAHRRSRWRRSRPDEPVDDADRTPRHSADIEADEPTGGPPVMPDAAPPGAPEIESETAEADADAGPDVEYPWLRKDEVDLDLRGAPTWDPGEYPTEPERDGSRRAGRALKWMLARSEAPASGTEAPPAAVDPPRVETSAVDAPPVEAPPVEAPPVEAPSDPPSVVTPVETPPVAASIAAAAPADTEPEAAPSGDRRHRFGPRFRRRSRADAEDEAIEWIGTLRRAEAPVPAEPPRPPEPLLAPTEPAASAQPAALPTAAELADLPITDWLPAAGTGAETASPPERPSPRPSPGPRHRASPSGTAASSGWPPPLDQDPAPLPPRLGISGEDSGESPAWLGGGISGVSFVKPGDGGKAQRSPELTRFLAASDPRPGGDEPPAILDDEPAPGDWRKWRGWRFVIRTGVIMVIAALAAVLLRTFVVSPYYIPSASMEPTLHGCPGCTDDHILVDKISYRTHDPREGDIVVFNRPATWHVPDQVVVKRVIGLPGDKLQLKKGHVLVNGLLLDESYVNSNCKHGTQPIPIGGRSKWTVPANDVFVMGDNRCNSDDSRAFGPIPQSNIIGRAFMIIWPLNRIRFL
jgi:signal peptidase I